MQLYHQGSGCYITAAKPDAQTAFVYVHPPLADNYPDTLPLTKVLAAGVNAGAFCFVPSFPSSAENFAVEIRRLCMEGPKGRIHFLWVATPDAPTESDIRFTANEELYLPIAAPVSFSCRNAFLHLQYGKGSNPFPSIGINSEGNGLLIRANSASIALQQSGKPAPLNVPVTEINLQLADAVQGIMQFDVALSEADIDALDIGLRYFWQQSGKAESCLSVRYPLFALPQGSTMPLQGNFDPWHLNDSARTYYQFLPGDSGGAPQFGSYLRTLLGRELNLTPQLATAPPRLLFADKPGTPPTGEESVYLVPSGGFTLGITDAVTGGSDTWQEQLLCGLSGTECLSLNPAADALSGDTLQFIPGRNACTTLTNGTPGKGDLCFAGLSDTYTTAWTMLLAGAKASPSWYFSEPDASPLFQHTATDASDAVTDYLPVSQSKLPLTPGDVGNPNCFPLVPYAASQGDSGSAIDGSDIARFEQQILNPHRKGLIAAMANPPSATPAVEGPAGPVDGTLLTQQGVLNSFSSGIWTQIGFAQVNGQELAFTSSQPKAKPPTPLPQALQNAFLTNQQFLVVSIANDNLGTLTESLTMSGWTFDLRPPATQMVGDYRNVLIFKSAQGTIKELAASPEKWTAYDAFNDAKLDPNGTYLSRWMLEYFEAAEQAYKGGKGATAFENFCTLINDPKWSGFIVLRVDVDMGALPAELAALTAGIDMSRFYAHHVGNEITRIKPDIASAQGYIQNSAVFGLLYYTDPAYAQATASGGRMALIQNSPATYDFTVLSLIAVFENAALVTFSSKVMLLMNRLFEASVLQQNPTSDDPPATNRLILDGAVQQHNGVAVYSFATPKDEESYFFLAGDTLDSIRIERAEFGVRSQSGTPDNGGETFRTRFNLWGDFAFQPGPPLDSGTAKTTETFDLFSYRQLAFSTLAIDMDFTLKQSNGEGSVSDRSFAFDSSQMTLDQQQLQIDDQATAAGINYARTGSLLSQFPLKLKGFVQATTQTPAAMGYGAVTTPPLKRAGLIGKLQAPWYGLSYQLDIGSMGALANNAVFTADMLFAWSPASGAWYVGMKLPGLGPLDKLLDIEGVIKFGAQEVLFDRIEAPVFCGGKDKSVPLYTIKFASIGLTLLGLSFPARGSTNALIFGDPCRTGDTPPKTLGWFGSYVRPGQDEPPALSGPDKG
jgi:hypothetical protein